MTDGILTCGHTHVLFYCLLYTMYMWILETRLTKVIQIRVCVCVCVCACVCVLVYQLSYKSVFVFQESVESHCIN